MIQMAAQRTREILQGAEPEITPVDEEKAGSTAIREIEAGLYTIEDYENRSM
jgi:DNA-directed RNA polymerase omega subunit